MLLPTLASGGLSRKNAQSRANRSLLDGGRRTVSHYARSLFDGSKKCCLSGAGGLGAPLECAEQPMHEA